MNSQGSTAIQAFVFPRTKHKVRVVIDKHGNPWWVAKDVCKALSIANSRDALSRLDDDEKDCVVLTDAMGRPRETAVVNESGLYSLILTSRKPEAKAFQKWVTSEVLPSIRKTGAYGHNSQQQFDPSDPHQLLPCLLEYTQRTIQLEAEKAKLKTKLEAQTPVVHAYKRLAAAEGSMNITEAAKNLRMLPSKLTEYMLDADWLYMRPPSTRKIAFQAKINQGWMESEPVSKDLGDGRTYVTSQPKVTGTGLLRLARELNIVLEEPPQ